MPELRKDPIVARWVIVAKSRAERPHDFEAPPLVRRQSRCPFCEGNEDETPEEVLAYRTPGSLPNRPGWRVRVVRNKFPALHHDGDLNKHTDGLYHTMEGVGSHEVIVESPKHLVSTSHLTEGELGEVLAIYRDRLVDLRKDPRLAYGMIFKNVGTAAGASLEHTHSQLIATPIVPINVWEEMTGSLEFYNYRGRCVYCELIQKELAAEQRIVVDGRGFIAFCPFASRFPFETWVVPKVHASHYESLDGNAEVDLAAVLKEVIGRLETALDQPSYNYILHTSPFDTQALKHYHWHIEIMPSLTRAAGYEWGSGFYINAVPPEEAAAVLRKVEIESCREKLFRPG
jgi:UDPglucose--hexose-1-phosphate uridylyltransferase